MKVLAERDGRVFARAAIDGSIDGPDGFASPFAGDLFPCLIWGHDGAIEDDGRFAIARALRDAGCRYAVCGGQNCEAWHDAIDTEFELAHLDEPDGVADAALVMTTWHEGQSPEEVAFFFVYCTNFDGHDFRSYLVLHVGTGPTQDQVDEAVRTYALNGNLD